jgi:arsenate reductase (thioredoxin)
MESKMERTRILFLCTGNSCRSQMAEGWARYLKGGLIDAYSAGIEKRGLDPRAVQVMAESGVDISSQHSKLIEDVQPLEFDYVITVCDHARETCPLFPGRAKVIHMAFEDPPDLARDETEERERLKHYRRIRDAIRDFVQGLPESLIMLA